MALQPSRPRGESPRGRRLRAVPDPPDDLTRRVTPGDETEPESVARAICLGLLEQRAHTRAELAAKLAGRGVRETVAEAVLDRLCAVALVDDAAYASDYVSTRRRDRGLSRRALATELRRKGVSDEHVADAVAEVSDDDEHAQARLLVDRRLPSLGRFDREVQVRRLVGMLARKGYPSGLAYSVVRERLDLAAGEGDDAW